MQKISISLLLCLCLCAAGVKVKAQNSSGKVAQIEGFVYEQGVNGKPIPFAVVILSPSEQFATTGMDGKFEIKKVEPGKTGLKIQFVGMEPIDTTIDVKAGSVTKLRFVMKQSNFRLEEVTVLATQNKAGSSTASNISRQAMDHLQSSSLKDVMQLLPGVSMQNADLSKENTISIRTLSSKNESANMNSLGTAVIVDGAPLSNNANMQSLKPGSSAGVDLRSLSTDNVESVEVIRGIPSVEYGDLTSGAVIVRSKAGKEPLTLRFKTNPSIYQVSASKGLDLGGKAGNLNISGDYAYNINVPTEAYAYFQRFNFKALYSKSFSENFRTNTSVDLTYGLDKRDKNPDDQRTQRATGAKSTGIRLNTNGTYTANVGWLKTIRYNLSASYTDRHSFDEQLLGNAFAPYSQSYLDGAIISNRPGQQVFDKDGNELTNIYPSESDRYATYLPNEYFSRYDIYGKEVNVFAKVTANFNKRWNSINNNILVGVDFKTDGNLGDGKVYDPAAPPLQSAGGTAIRPRAYYDDPFINQLGIFVEDRYLHSFGERDLNISAGARFDYINGMTCLTPRINASFDVIPHWLTLRGGFGIAAKAPVAYYIHPEDAYFDYVNFNNLGDQSVPKNEQLLLATTRMFETKNHDLEIAKNRKAEVGFDLKFKKARLSVTAYDERMKNGYGFGRDFSTFKLIEYNRYKIAQQNPGTIPTLELENKYNVFASFSKPLNNIKTHNQGVEYELDFGRFSAIRTSFSVNGAWMKSKHTNGGYSFSTLPNGNNLERHIGVYEPGKESELNEILLSTFRITHNIPRIGFVFTVSAQVTWMEKAWYEYGNDVMFIKYISYKDGNVHDFDPSMKNDPEFSYLFPAVNEKRFIVEKRFPTTMFNFLLSKEIGDFLTASFFVNNVFNNRPLYESKKNPGSFTELGIPIFFGFDLKINLK